MVLTHHHRDHTDALDIVARLAPAALVVAHAATLRRLMHPEPASADGPLAQDMHPMVEPRTTAALRSLRTLDVADGALLPLAGGGSCGDISVWHLPGHTDG